MPLPEPRPGLVLRYGYLWADEHDQGRDEGVKARPCVVVVATQRIEGELLVTVVPITHTAHGAGAVPLPSTTKARLGLDDEASWIVCTEVNRFVWPGPDLHPVARDGRWAYGMLPAILYERIRRSLVGEIRRQRIRIVPRA